MAQSRKVTRNLQSMRAMLLQHQHEDRNPPLQAINTLYLSLLEGNANDEAWQVFNKLASLPLVTTKFIPKCKADDGYYGFKGVWQRGVCGNYPHCAHANVEVSCTVQLTPLDHHRLDFGHTAKGLSQWWGSQLADALGAHYQQ